MIRVYCISTVMVETYLIFKGGANENVLYENSLKYHLISYEKSEYIALLAVYLLSDSFTWMTGSNV